MKIPSKIINEFQVLLTKSLEHVIRDDEINRLNEIFHEYPEITSLYHQFITVNLALNQSNLFSEEVQPDDTFYDLLTELAQQEKTAPSVEREVDTKPKEPTSETQSKSTVKPVKTGKTLPLLAAISVMILLLLIFTAQFAPSEVATITDMLDAKVKGPVLTPRLSRLSNKSTPISLTTGIMKITFDCGVEAVIEGPAEFRITSAKSMSLNKGKLYARVSPLGRGFWVETATSSIVDLGTEFGIQVFDDQTSTVHMITGRAKLEAKRSHRRQAKQYLTEGQARRMSTSGKITSIDLNQSAFIRDINSETETYWRGECLSVIPLPTQNSDDASGIRTDKTYTHLLDFGHETAAVINEVTFSPIHFKDEYTDTVFRDDSLNLVLMRSGARAFLSFPNERQVENADGGMQALLSNGLYITSQSLPDYYTLTLTGLTPGQKYSLRLYYCPDQMGNNHPIQVVFNGEGHDKQIQINQLTQGAHYVRYDYTANSEQVDITFRSTTDDRTWHLYGLTNEIINLGHASAPPKTNLYSIN